MTQSRLLLGWLVALLIVPRAACQQPSRSPLHHRVSGSEQYVTVWKTAGSGIETVERIVVADSTAWSKMWTRLMSRHVVPPARPAVNFDTSLVVVATAGPGASGTSIQIDSLRLRENELVVYVRKVMAGVGCQGDLMIRYPAHVIQISRPGKPVRFVDDSVITSRCDS
jgi:hypothetical protein